MKPRHLNDGVDAMNCNIDDGGAVCLGNALAIDNKLRHLQISGNEAITSAGWEGLSICWRSSI